VASSAEDENEIKLTLSPGDLEKVFKNLSKKAKGDIKHKFRPRLYYDTEDFDLYKNNISLRVQYKRGGKGRLGAYEQTIKIENGASSVPGVLSRKECKDDIGGPLPDFSAVSNALAKAAIQPFAGKKLGHIFTAAMERRYFILSAKDRKKKAKLEIAFDVGYLVLPGGAAQEMHEIEIEKKQGDDELIAKVRDEIMKMAPSAQMQTLPKSAQGTLFYLKNNP